ncbi:MAG: M24 family metallopeptidase [Collinsella sp.]
MQSYCEDAGFSVVREFVGHGTGGAARDRSAQLRPSGPRPALVPGMTIAIEPMICQYDCKITQPGRLDGQDQGRRSGCALSSTPMRS